MADVGDNSLGNDEVFISSDIDYEYTKNGDGTINYCTDYRINTYTYISISEVINGYTVTKIGDFVFENSPYFSTCPTIQKTYEQI